MGDEVMTEMLWKREGGMYYGWIIVKVAWMSNV